MAVEQQCVCMYACMYVCMQQGEVLASFSVVGYSCKFLPRSASGYSGSERYNVEFWK